MILLGKSALCRYRLSIIATDPAIHPQEQDAKTIELVLFGSIAEELIGTPAGTLIASNGGVGTFLPTRITALYGKQYELRVSISSISLQRINIIYQVDAIVGTGTAPQAIASPPQQGISQTTNFLSIHLSVSLLSLQRINIIYKIHATIGTVNDPEAARSASQSGIIWTPSFFIHYYMYTHAINQLPFVFLL